MNASLSPSDTGTFPTSCRPAEFGQKGPAVDRRTAAASREVSTEGLRSGLAYNQVMTDIPLPEGKRSHRGWRCEGRKERKEEDKSLQ